MKNSKDLAKELKDRTLIQEEVLVSFDVVSLFTKVPIPEAVEVVRKHLESDDTLENRTNLNVDDIVDLLQFLCSTTYFSFQNTIYEQKVVTAMGSPMSPIRLWKILKLRLSRHVQKVANHLFGKDT